MERTQPCFHRAFAQAVPGRQHPPGRELNFLPPTVCVKTARVETVSKLTNELVASYARVGGINHLDGKNLPSKRAITAITHDLLRLLFPGFFDEKPLHSSE